MVLLGGRRREMDFKGRPWLMTPDFNDVHVPVLAEEVVALLGGSGDTLDPTGLIVDATLGAGGHSASLLECFPRIRVIGTDQDPSILECARKRLEPHGDRVRLVQCRISELSRLLRKLRTERPVGFLFDFGASSLQLDTPSRGFSFQEDGPLDMRMDPCRVRTAADVVNTWDEEDLADLFYHEGGEKRSRPIAAEIVRCRSRAAFHRTGALAELVVRIVGRTGKIHPATRVFQALRRAVNQEGDELLAGLETAEHWLADGGVLAAISFHSGEDREVKHFLREGVARDCWRLEPKKPIQASREEQRKNSRARSAILRGAVRVRGEDECE